MDNNTKELNELIYAGAKLVRDKIDIRKRNSNRTWIRNEDRRTTTETATVIETPRKVNTQELNEMKRFQKDNCRQV